MLFCCVFWGLALVEGLFGGLLRGIFEPGQSNLDASTATSLAVGTLEQRPGWGIAPSMLPEARVHTVQVLRQFRVLCVSTDCNAVVLGALRSKAKTGKKPAQLQREECRGCTRETAGSCKFITPLGNSPLMP